MQILDAASRADQGFKPADPTAQVGDVRGVLIHLIADQLQLSHVDCVVVLRASRQPGEFAIAQCRADADLTH